MAESTRLRTLQYTEREQLKNSSSDHIALAASQPECLRCRRIVPSVSIRSRRWLSRRVAPLPKCVMVPTGANASFQPASLQRRHQSVSSA